MASLKELRVRISSVTSTRQITSAMKMVSAAKLRRAQDGIQQLRPYAVKLTEILSDISRNMDTANENVFAQQREPRKILVVVITSNRGLCGAFNANVIKRSILIANEKYSRQLAKGDVSFITIGKKGNDYLRAKKYKIINNYSDIFDRLGFDHVAPIAQTIMQTFIDKKFDKIEFVYNQFKNAAVQVLTEEQFLPIELKENTTGSKKKSYDYIFEPSKEYIVQELIPKSLKIQLFKALLDSYASEHGARMTAMHKATDNATEMLRELRLTYNKARQASITNEILEIVGGAEALTKK